MTQILSANVVGRLTRACVHDTQTFLQSYLSLNSRGICSGDEHILNRLEPTIRKLCDGYASLYAKQVKSKTLKEAQKDEFFGLRDFYRYSENISVLYTVFTPKRTIGLPCVTLHNVMSNTNKYPHE